MSKDARPRTAKKTQHAGEGRGRALGIFVTSKHCARTLPPTFKQKARHI